MISTADLLSLKDLSIAYENRIQIVGSAFNVVQASTLIDTFVVTYSYSCELTILIDRYFAPLELYLGETSIKKDMFFDTLSESKGDSFFCGERLHTIIDLQTSLPPNWIRFGWKEEAQPLEVILDPLY